MQPAQPGFLEAMFPFFIILAIFYFFIIRPQSKRQKEHTKFLAELKVGDQVISSAGIVGTVDGLNENFVTLKVESDTRIRILRKQISSALKDLPTTTPVKTK